MTTWVALSDWVLAQVTRTDTRSRHRSLGIVTALTLLIGAVDYASGIRISLAVFYLVPVLLATAWLGWRAGVACAFASVLLRIVGDHLSNDGRTLPFWSLWNSCTALLMFLFIVWIFSRLLALYRRLEQRVEERTAALSIAAERRAQLEHDLLMISARERNSLGQELHDDICQHLVGTALAAKVLAQRLASRDPELARPCGTIVEMVEEGIAKTRRLAKGLLLSSVEPHELAERLNELVDESARAGVASRFEQVGELRLDDPAVTAQMFRIAQEATRNALRHSGARRIDVSLVADANEVCLTIEDDGSGLPEPRAASGLGLQIMSHRAAYIGATLSLVSTAGRGTRVVCHLPLADLAA